MSVQENSIALTGRRVVITGGASGMGAGLVRAFPQLGAQVVSLDLARDPGASIAQDAGAKFVAADVSDLDSVKSAVDEAVSLLGGLDVLIHAAGIAPGGPAEDITLATWSTVMSINATGTFLTNQAAFEHLKDSGSLEQDADAVVILHCKEDEPARVWFNCAKNRQGPTWRIPVEFDRSLGHFRGLKLNMEGRS